MKLVAVHSDGVSQGSMGRFASVLEDGAKKPLEVPRYAADGSIKKVAVLDVDGDYIYTRVRAVSDMENWGPNKNGDAFPHDELDKSWHTFIGALNFKNHESDKVENAIGYVPDAYWNKEAGFVEALLATDRKRAANIVRGVEKGEITDVSMGCRVEYSDCSICGNRAYVEADYCDHIRNHKGRKIQHQGKLKDVYEINHGLNFFEVSWVIDGADPNAMVIERIASNKGGSTLKKEAYPGGDLGALRDATNEKVKNLDNDARGKETESFEKAAKETASNIKSEEKPRQQGYKPNVLASLANTLSEIGRNLLSFAEGNKQQYPDGGGPVEADLVKPNPEAEMLNQAMGLPMEAPPPVDPEVLMGGEEVVLETAEGEQMEHEALDELEEVAKALVKVVEKLRVAENVEHSPPGDPPPKDSKDEGDSEKSDEEEGPVGKKMADIVSGAMNKKADSGKARFSMLGAPIRHTASDAVGKIADINEENIKIAWVDGSESTIPLNEIKKGQFQVRVAAWPHELLESTPMDYGQEAIRDGEVAWYNQEAEAQKRHIEEDYNRINLTRPWMKPEGGWRQEAAVERFLALRKAALDRVAWDAKFTPAENKEDSAWTIYANGKPAVRATISQMWGDQAQEKFAEVASKEYKQALLERVSNLGIEHIAQIWGVKPLQRTAQAVTEAAAGLLKKAGKVTDSTDMSGLQSYYEKMFGDSEFASALTKGIGENTRVASEENDELKKLAGENMRLKNELARVYRTQQAKRVVQAMVESNVITKEAAAAQLKKLVDMPAEAFAAVSEMFIKKAESTNEFPGSTNYIPPSGSDDPGQVGLVNNSLDLEGGEVRDYSVEYPGEEETLTDAGPDLSDANLAGVEDEVSDYPGVTTAANEPELLRKAREHARGFSAGDGVTQPPQMRKSASAKGIGLADVIGSTTPFAKLSGGLHTQSRGFVDPRK